MNEVPPPLLKSLTIRMSPTVCCARFPLESTNLPALGPLVARDTRPWKNQNPCWASPLLSKRSEPKYSSSQDVTPARTGQEALGVSEYRAAKLSWRLSLSGKPPVWSFHCQLDRSIGSFDPPPVKIVAFCA